MTDFFQFSDLTWPEVAALPRSVPLILPLGEGYSLAELAHALGNPETAGLLPAIPYGWTGSCLPVAESPLTNMLQNLLASMRADGFEKVLALIPDGLEIGLNSEFLTLPAAPGIADSFSLSSLDASSVILIPIGHTEQHGYHLPLSTDTLIIEAIGTKTAEFLPYGAAVCLPVMPYGVSTHRASFAGTFNIGGRAFEDFWLGVIDQLAANGTQKVYLLSGHGGNCSFLTNVVKYAGEQHPHIFCATSWLYLSGPEGIAALEQHRRSPRGGMGHACELETALLLALRPDLVKKERVVDEIDFISTPSYYMDWVEGGALVANPPWNDDTKTGAYGAGSLATLENGTIWMQVAVSEKAAHVYEIIEQYARRQARRQERGT